VQYVRAQYYTHCVHVLDLPNGRLRKLCVEQPNLCRLCFAVSANVLTK